MGVSMYRQTVRVDIGWDKGFPLGCLKYEEISARMLYSQSQLGIEKKIRKPSSNLLCSGKCVIFLVDDNHVDYHRA